LITVAASQIGCVPTVEVDERVLSHGKRLYEVSCGGCHQNDGGGKMGVASPLSGSEWVLGPDGVLIRIALDGIRGPIEVKGVGYQLEMPAMRHLYDDAQMAAILTYMRRAWGNRGTPVSPGAVGEIRTSTARRGDSWTAPELLAMEKRP
jgi:mono/diheme cytochrome c family protein